MCVKHKTIVPLDSVVRNKTKKTFLLLPLFFPKNGKKKEIEIKMKKKIKITKIFSRGWQTKKTAHRSGAALTADWSCWPVREKGEFGEGRNPTAPPPPPHTHVNRA
jgi:hypothetical protein